MFKKIRQKYWKLRDRGEEAKVLLLFGAILFALILFIVLIVAVRPFKDTKEQSVPEQTETIFIQETSTVVGDSLYTEEEATTQLNVTLVNFEVLKEFLSGDLYLELENLISEKSREYGNAIAEKHPYQITDKKKLRLTFFVVLGTRVLRGEYDLKENKISISNCTYNLQQLNSMQEEKNLNEMNNLFAEFQQYKLKDKEEPTTKAKEKATTKKTNKK